MNNPPPLTLEQQRGYLRRIQVGWKAASDGQAATARGRTEQEAWEAANRLLSDWPHVRRRQTVTSGLVEQQRLWMKLHRK